MGMFNTVKFPCPACGLFNEFQSKAGECKLAEYNLSEIPEEVALDLIKEENFRCFDCNKRIVFLPKYTITVTPIVIGN